LAELSRREKEANIKPDPDVDVFMKVRRRNYQHLLQQNKLMKLILRQLILIHSIDFGYTGNGNWRPTGKCSN